MALRVAPQSWLSDTPEPERELPQALATLRHEADPPPPRAVREEEERIEKLILHGSQRDWLAYPTGAPTNTDPPRPSNNPGVVRVRAIVREVIANHHNLLLGLPGRAAERAADERRRLNGGPAGPLPSPPRPPTSSHPSSSSSSSGRARSWRTC